jgi:hypothetical protein
MNFEEFQKAWKKAMEGKNPGYVHVELKDHTIIYAQKYEMWRRSPIFLMYDDLPIAIVSLNRIDHIENPWGD